MRNYSMMTRALCVSALLLSSATPAFARGKTDRAHEAIAAAKAKVEAANKLGASGEVPRLQAQAQAALRSAEEDLAAKRKDEAIAEANRASELADTAIGISERNRNEAVNAERAAAADAQQEAAAANARAQAAQQEANAAAADAAAARATPPPAPIVIAPPAPTPTTTITTETVKTAAPATVARKKVTVRKPVRRVVKRSSTPARTVEKTTTTVTTKAE
ncbi:hypothetical protein G4G27_18210 [Sphingomonas sp. So64.6b]|uniref:hypothetical protein n=1 Tax=Sphingomonas sp. So64.6b TaxID=2997354 RepID=UPI0018613EB6|nr:hypothetical protein [Sphingomonas sp. So64.6b]QNA85699.1 hypothetical protein G4G27_18210 [Sphingomonas sp. So64.6b]